MASRIHPTPFHLGMYSQSASSKTDQQSGASSSCLSHPDEPLVIPPPRRQREIASVSEVAAKVSCLKARLHEIEEGLLQLTHQQHQIQDRLQALVAQPSSSIQAFEGEDIEKLRCLEAAIEASAQLNRDIANLIAHKVSIEFELSALDHDFNSASQAPPTGRRQRRH